MSSLRTGSLFFMCCLVALVLGAASAAQSPTQRAVMVWESNCIELSKDRSTRFEAPMVDGQPDLKHGTLVKPVIKLSETCGHYEVRR